MPATIIDHATGETTVYENAAQVAHNWWAVLLRGVAYILFGIAAFFAPGVTLYAGILAFGVFALVSGAFILIAGIRTRQETKRWWLVIVQGLMGIAVGVTAFTFPSATALALLYIVAFWALLTGGMEIAAAIRLREEIRGEWLLALSGAASVLIGLAMLFAPGAGLLAWMWVLGLYAVVTGGVLVALAFRLRRLDRAVVEQVGPSAGRRQQLA